MNKFKLLDLLERKRTSLTDQARVEELAVEELTVQELGAQELDLLAEDRIQRDSLFLYETRDVKKIARTIFLLDALNSGRHQFQIEHPRLFARARSCYREFTTVISPDNLERLIGAYTMFVDREMRLKPFDDSYLTVTKVINTISEVSETQPAVARRLCSIQERGIQKLYTLLEDIPFKKDDLVREKYEAALKRLD